MSQSDKIIGIDLGTTNSVLAITQDGQAQIVPVDGADLLPSVVGVADNGDLLVGTAAHNQWVVAPDRTIRSIKRKIGSNESVTMAGVDYTPQEISAFILRQLKQAAEAKLGQPVSRAVITVPAYFNEVQRQATIEAGEIAGLQVERIINEPTAASLAYGYGLQDDENMRMLVYDLGGGTFDVSLIELNYGVVDVMATAGDNTLGGDDFDERLAVMLSDEFWAQHKIDLPRDHVAHARLLRAAEEAKIALSSAPSTTVSLEYIAEDSKGNPLHIERTIERVEFEALIDDLLEQTISCIDQAINDANIAEADIDRILLIGGSTRIPAVWHKVAERMKKDPHAEIDPDAAVALGAAVQGGIIAGEEIDAILVDVTPLSLGIETAGMSLLGELQIDKFAPLIHRNATIPVRKSEIFTTMYPGQDSVQIKVYQGESNLASQNTLLGDFMVEELEPSGSDGIAKVTVDFRLDINGILDVTVTDKESGKQVTESLKADRKRLSPEQIAASQDRLATLYGDEDDGAAGGDGTIEIDGVEIEGTAVVLDDETSALVERARSALAEPDLDTTVASQIRTIIEAIRTAASAGSADRVDELSDDLIDILFDIEE